MPAPILAQLIIALGPPALSLARDLAKVWNEPTLTPQQVEQICGDAQKSYDSYIADAKAKLNV